MRPVNGAYYFHFVLPDIILESFLQMRSVLRSSVLS